MPLIEPGDTRASREQSEAEKRRIERKIRREIARRNLYQHLVESKETKVDAPAEPMHFEHKTLFSPLSEENADSSLALIEKAKHALEKKEFSVIPTLLGPHTLCHRIQYNQKLYGLEWDYMVTVRNRMLYVEAEKFMQNYVKQFFQKGRRFKFFSAYCELNRELDSQQQTELIQAMRLHLNHAVVPQGEVTSVIDSVEKCCSTSMMQLVLSSRNKEEKKEMKALVSQEEKGEHKKSEKAESKEEKKSQSSTSVSAEKDNTTTDTRLISLSATQQLYPLAMREQYKTFLENTTSLREKFIQNFSEEVYSSKDVAAIYQWVEEKVSFVRIDQEGLLREQEDLIKDTATNEKKAIEAFARIAEKNSDARQAQDLHMEAMLLDDLTLEKEQRPFLHIVIQQYYTESKETEKAKLFPIIKMLMERGCSPYKYKEAKENEAKANAYDITNSDGGEIIKTLCPNWSLLVTTLSYMISRSPASEKVRKKLLVYCEESIKQLNETGWTFFHSEVTKNGTRLPGVAEIVKELYQAQQNFSDGALLTMLKTQREKHRPSFLRSSGLFTLLDTIISEIEHGELVHVPSATAIALQERSGKVPETRSASSSIVSSNEVSNNDSNQNERKDCFRGDNSIVVGRPVFSSNSSSGGNAGSSATSRPASGAIPTNRQG